MTRALSYNFFVSAVLPVIVIAGCSQFKADKAPVIIGSPKLAGKACSGEFIKLYADVATEVSGKDYATQIANDVATLEKTVKACDALMAAAPHGACDVQANQSSFSISDADYENLCLQVAQDLRVLKNPAGAPADSPDSKKIKVCSDEFVQLYQGVSTLVAGKDYGREIKRNAGALKSVLKACDALTLESPHGHCQNRQDSFLPIISDLDFENLCLDADEDYKNLIANRPVVIDLPKPVAGVEEVVLTQPQVMSVVGQNILNTDVVFELRATQPAALSQSLLSQRLRENFILYFVGGTRLTQSPSVEQMGIGCSIYTNTALSGADLAKPFGSPQKTVKLIKSGVIVLFELHSAGKKLNLQCFKKITGTKANFTLSDISKHLGGHFQVVQKNSSLMSQAK